jgi:uncharacterized protein (TIGR03663 family)
MTTDKENFEEIQAVDRDQISDKLWIFGCVAVTAIATFLRFWQLTLKPLHHDEGVNGFFLTTLFREGIYKYDPANYHGPDLYYFALAFSKVFGLNTISIRASVAVFGVLTVVLALYLYRWIGKIGAISAALFLALSPGMVYISRYFIHEILFVFFSLAIVVSVLYFYEKRKVGAVAVATMTLILLVCFLPTVINLSTYAAGENTILLWALRVSLFAVEAILVFMIMRMLFAWNDGRPIYLIIASASAVMLFATKETAFITIGTMAIACLCVLIWQKIYRVKPEENELEPVALTWRNFRERIGNSTDLLLMIVAVSFIFIYLGVLFFSSFFTYPNGVLGAFEAYMIWTKTGSKDHTQNGYLAYIKWGFQLELPIFILSAIGTVIALIKAKHRFAMFAGLWAFGLFLAYTIIPYKTPWLALSFMLPMCIIGGYGINEIASLRGFWYKIAAGILALTAAVVMAYQTYDLNFVRYDDDSMAYIYAHTKRGFLDLVNKVEYYADKSGKGKDATIEIVSPDYWSMPWYMNDYKNAKFGGSLIDVNTAEMIVASKAQEPELNERYGAHYKYVGTYPLRPGVELMLLVRKDIADADAIELYKLNELVRKLNFRVY